MSWKILYFKPDERFSAESVHVMAKELVAEHPQVELYSIDPEGLKEDTAEGSTCVCFQVTQPDGELWELEMDVERYRRGILLGIQDCDTANSNAKAGEEVCRSFIAPLAARLGAEPIDQLPK